MISSLQIYVIGNTELFHTSFHLPQRITEGFEMQLTMSQQIPKFTKAHIV